jgi:hypothetical protein
MKHRYIFWTESTWVLKMSNWKHYWGLQSLSLRWISAELLPSWNTYIFQVISLASYFFVSFYVFSCCGEAFFCGIIISVHLAVYICVLCPFVCIYKDNFWGCHLLPVNSTIFHRTSLLQTESLRLRGNDYIWLGTQITININWCFLGFTLCLWL